MKKLPLILFVAVLLLTSCEPKTKTHNGLPLIDANSDQASYKLGDDFLIEGWTISPEIESDTLVLKTFFDENPFTFFTDVDSISFDLKAGDTRRFYVKRGDSLALTAVKKVLQERNDLQFDLESTNDSLQFEYEDANTEYLTELRNQYPIDSLIKGAHSDVEKAQRIMNWVHNLWKHNGRNTPKKSDAISILKEVEGGQQFRCVEYGIVTTACLNAIGIKTRVLSLRIKDVETTEYGAGHVALEAYFPNLNKWVLLDPQFNAMPTLNGTPLNAVEFQKAINERYHDVEVKSLTDLSKSYYINWIYPYLYYFSVPFSNDSNPDLKKIKFNDKGELMLVPLGAKNPTVFQRIYPIDNAFYTNSIKDFYRAPR